MQYEELCKEVERKLQRELKTRGDFNYLSEQILKKVHESLSPNTLMRLWGYRKHVNARQSTLDILARFVGYEDYTHFMAERGCVDEEESKEAEAGQSRSKSAPSPWKWLIALAALILAIGVSVFLYNISKPTVPPGETFMLGGIKYSVIDDNTVKVARLTYSGNIVIPNSVTYNGKIFSVTEIANHAFYDCDKLISDCPQYRDVNRPTGFFGV